MDISDTLAPNSDQLDAAELVGGERTFTVTAVTVNRGSDQPVSVHLAEFPRVWRPGKTMRRVLAAAWGKDSDGWIGKRATLYCDSSVMFGGEAVGGIRIRALSGIGDKPLRVPVIVKRGKGGMYHVEPLRETAPTSPDPSPEEIAACEDQGQLRAWWQTATDPSIRDLIAKRGSALREAATDE